MEQCFYNSVELDDDVFSSQNILPKSISKNKIKQDLLSTAYTSTNSRSLLRAKRKRKDNFFEQPESPNELCYDSLEYLSYDDNYSVKYGENEKEDFETTFLQLKKDLTPLVFYHNSSF